MKKIQLCLLVISLWSKVVLADDDDDDTINTSTIINNPGVQSGSTIDTTSSATAIAVAPTTQTRDTRRDTTQVTTTDDLVQVTLQRQTTTSQQTQTVTSSTRLDLFLTSQAASKTTENDEDKSLFKLLFTVPTDDIFYNANFKFGNDQEIGLRLDLIQPEIWVMNNENFLDCNSVDNWINSQLSSMDYTYTTGELPSQITDAPEYTSNCGYFGLYSSLESNMPPATNAIAAVNNQSYRIPYMNAASAEGEFVTDDIEFNLTNGDYFVLPNVTFLDANDSNVLLGGIGLAGTPKGSGFLYALTNLDIIDSPGYSLWFNNDTDQENAIAQLIPGAVNTKYFVGDLYQFDMIAHRGFRFNASQQTSNQDLIELTLPVIEIEELLVANLNSGQSVSVKSDSGGLPVLIDSRSSYFYLPLDIIVNIAIQTNAYYSGQLARWLVKCQPLLDVKATIQFQIGNLTVNVPISELITDAVYEGSSLNFESGDKACLLKVLPSSVSGYNSLGLPFLKYIYLVVDNEGGTIGLANLNKFLQVDKEDLEDYNSILYNQTMSSTQSGTRRNSTRTNRSIGYISSGSIPFATTYTPESNSDYGDVTLSYSQASRVSGESVILHIPARFSGAIVSGGSIYITGDGSGNANSITTSAMNATAAGTSSNGQIGKYQDSVIIDIGGLQLHNKLISTIMTLGLLLVVFL